MAYSASLNRLKRDVRSEAERVLRHIDAMRAAHESLGWRADQARSAIGRLLEDLDSNVREVSADIDACIDGGGAEW